jgi:hypothetical protein
VRFEYLGSTQEGEAGAWSSSWESDGPPTAVRANVTIEEPGRPASTHSAVVYLPVGPAPKDDDHDAS